MSVVLSDIRVDAIEELASGRHAQKQLWADLEAQATEKGACLRCLRESDWRGARPKLVRHRTKNYHDDG